MPTPQGRMVNVVPTKENVDYDRIYYYDSEESIEVFKFLGFNRETNDKNIKKIARQLNDETHGSMFIPPVTVDINTMSIVDGQNRYVAFKRSFREGGTQPMKVIYQDVPKEYLDELIKLLQEGKKWDNKDYFRRAIANGNKACSEIELWCERHEELCTDRSGINRSYAMAFIYGRRVDREVKDLTLTITQKQLEFAEKIYKEVLAMFNAMKYKRANFIEGMAQSWYGIRKDKNSAINFFIDEMGMDFICKNIYEEMRNHQPNTKKSDWDYKFGQIMQNLYVKHQRSKAA